MSEPLAVGDALQRVAQARAQVQPVVPLPAVNDGDEFAEARERSLGELRAMSWHSRCPQRFHRAVFDDIDPAISADVGSWLLLRPRPNLVLLGDVGTGKTHTALAANRVDHDKGLDVLFLPIVELLDLLRPGGPEHLIESVLHCDRLIIDDIGHERPTDWTAERLGAIVNRRWLEERPITATSNLSASELKQSLGDRTYSRLVGDGAVVLELHGADRRRQGGPK